MQVVRVDVAAGSIGLQYDGKLVVDVVGPQKSIRPSRLSAPRLSVMILVATGRHARVPQRMFNLDELPLALRRLFLQRHRDVLLELRANLRAHLGDHFPADLLVNMWSSIHHFHSTDRRTGKCNIARTLAAAQLGP